MNRLADKTAIVTGAGRGIGAAIARAFAAEGARVVVTDRDERGGKAVAEAVGGRFVRLDVTREADWERLAEAHPRIDVLVNNAGVTGLEAGTVRHDPEHATLQAWRGVLAVNLDGVFLGCRYGIRAMRAAGGGSIINISSRAAMVGVPAAAAYAASKAAVRNHTKTVALYCAAEGLNIRCNSIHPGAVLTPMWEPMLGKDADRDRRLTALARETPMRRFGAPEEIAAVAVLLAGDEAAYMTGSELSIDGGLSAGSATPPDGD